MTIYLLALILYSAAMILLGLLLSRKVRSSLAFFVADRRLGSGLLFSTLLAANIGAGSTVGAAGLGYALGLSGWWWVGSAGMGSLILAVTVGPRIRRLASEKGFLTLGDFLEWRYGAPVRVAVVVLLWLATLILLAGQLIAFAWILNVVAGTSRELGCILGGLVVMVYFSLGGLKGAAWINVLQLLVKGLGFGLALLFASELVGGWGGLVQRLQTRELGPAYLSLTGSGWSTVLPYLFLLVPSFIVSPGILQKVYGARDDRAVRLGVGFNGLALLGFSFVPVLLGMTAATLFPDLAHSELALPTLITNALPVWLGTLLLAAVFSAEISSADAALFMMATSLVQDLYRRFFNPTLDDRTLLERSRLISFASGILGIGAALLLSSVISALTLFYGLLSIALFGPVLIGLYRRRPGRWYCLATISISVVLGVTVHVLTGGSGWGIFSPTALGIAVSLALLIPASFRESGK